jgi:hypothetical protein
MSRNMILFLCSVGFSLIGILISGWLGMGCFCIAAFLSGMIGDEDE